MLSWQSMIAGGADPRLAWARYEMARTVLGKVTAATARDGIDILAVKGIVTSRWLYGDPGERLLTDVDIRVRPRDLGRVLDMARLEHWKLARRVHTYRAADLEVDGVQVDVEATVGPPGLVAMSVDRMLQRATRDADGFWVPEIHDHALLMTVNVFKDGLTGAAPWSVEDLRRVVHADAFDEYAFVDRLREGRIGVLGWIAADWLAGDQASARWGRIRSLLGGDNPPRGTYAKLVRKLVDQEHGALASRGVHLLMRTASDAIWRRPASFLLAAAYEAEVRLGLDH